MRYVISKINRLKPVLNMCDALFTRRLLLNVPRVCCLCICSKTIKGPSINGSRSDNSLFFVSFLSSLDSAPDPKISPMVSAKSMSCSYVQGGCLLKMFL
jgi:hypothetical protein